MTKDMKKKQTVTIGIPAHNEAVNISYLLDSILKQKGDNFLIEKIYVLCDGCTDATALKAEKVAKKYPIITVIDDEKRKGKAGRLNQLYRMNKSELVFNFDGDIILKGDRVIEKLVRAFETPETILVSGNNQPVKAETLTERVYNAGFKMWYEIRKNYKKGNNVANIHGCAVALKSSFAKTFKYPSTIVSSDQGFLFMTIKAQKKGFRFVKNAVVLFRSVNNLEDFFLQATRNLNISNNVAKHFGDWVHEEYRIPLKFKLKGIFKTLFSDPLFTTLAIILNLILRVFPKKQTQSKSGAGWELVKSTKKVVTIN